MQYVMKHKLIVIMIILVSADCGLTQTGLGVTGTLNYPGFVPSDLYNSRFGLGGGYEFFARHNLIQFGSAIFFHARYNYRKYLNDINLPFTAATRFYFTYLSVSVLCDVKRSNNFNIYTGGGVNLVTINAARDFLKVTETSLIPEVLSGVELYLSKNYNIFAECAVQFGSVPVRDDRIPLTGVRFAIGATMFFIEAE